MPDTSSAIGGEAAVAVTEPPVESEAAMNSTAGHSLGNSSASNKRAKIDETSSASPAEATPYMLPFELLGNIFLYLSTSDVTRAALVCQTWRAASKDVRVWRYLSFKQTRFIDNAPPVKGQSTVRAQFDSLGERSSNTVESVDFAD